MAYHAHIEVFKWAWNTNTKPLTMKYTSGEKTCIRNKISTQKIKMKLFLDILLRNFLLDKHPSFSALLPLSSIHFNVSYKKRIRD